MAAIAASWVLGLGILAFLGIASAMLLWDGLAAEMGRSRAISGRQLWRTRAELVIGAAGFAAALWVALGIFTHAH